MKITDIRLRELTGTLEHAGDFWEERLIRPVDIYPEHKDGPVPWMPERLEDGRYRMRSIFLQIETDDGVTGLGGPVPVEVAFIVDRTLRPLVLGQDPRASERLWDIMYRACVHGRKGDTMLAISAVDCALWDLRGRWFSAPVYQLLGGPVRVSFPAYASALGYSIEPARAAERAQALVAQGYRATKWFFRDGPADGPDGMRRNVRLVQALREAVGPDVDLMLDAWMSWDVPYTLAMAERLAEYAPRWLEEPVLPDKIDAYAAIRRRSCVPIAGGEHEYTRWGIRALIEARAVDVLQPDVYWAGGLTEMVKICALASAHDLPVIPHGHSTPASAHLIAAQPANVCPILEYLLKWNEVHQFFWRNPLRPVEGIVTVPDAPGLGMELDEAKIESERELRWE